jgi:hypothetical protein
LQKNFTEEFTVDAGEFLNLLIVGLYTKNRLTNAQILNWTVFLCGIISHSDIPDEAVFRMKSYLLFTYMLRPFASIYEDIPELERDEDDPLFELSCTIEFVMLKVIIFVPNAFAYEDIASECIKMFIEAITEFPKVFANDSDRLKPLRHMFLFHVSTCELIKLNHYFIIINYHLYFRTNIIYKTH